MFTSRGRREYPATNGAGGGLRGERNHRRRGRAERRMRRRRRDSRRRGILRARSIARVTPVRRVPGGTPEDWLIGRSHGVHAHAVALYQTRGARIRGRRARRRTRQTTRRDARRANRRQARIVASDVPGWIHRRRADRGGGDGGHRARGHGRHSNVFERRGGGAAPTTRRRGERVRRGMAGRG